MELPVAGAEARPPAPALTPEKRAELDALVHEHDLVLFMKGTPDAPRCGFSARAVEALRQTGRPFYHVDIFATDDPFTTVRQLAEWAQFPTLPQVWVKGELIGGSDIALEMVESGELQRMLA